MVFGDSDAHSHSKFLFFVDAFDGDPRFTFPPAKGFLAYKVYCLGDLGFWLFRMHVYGLCWLLWERCVGVAVAASRSGEW